jgi:hypothetical protein
MTSYVTGGNEEEVANRLLMTLSRSSRIPAARMEELPECSGTEYGLAPPRDGSGPTLAYKPI